MLFSFRLSTHYRLPVDFDAFGYVGWDTLKGILRAIFVGRFMEYGTMLSLYCIGDEMVGSL